MFQGKVSRSQSSAYGGGNQHYTQTTVSQAEHNDAEEAAFLLIGGYKDRAIMNVSFGINTMGINAFFAIMTTAEITASGDMITLAQEEEPSEQPLRPANDGTSLPTDNNTPSDGGHM